MRRADAGGDVGPDSGRGADCGAAAAELGRRYVELLAENLGQPGFRELLVTVHDIDAHRDLVFALLGERTRQRSSAGPATATPAEARRAEVFDLAGVARDHALDAVAAALAMPLATEPHLATFAPEGVLARRDAPPVRSAGEPDPAARGAGRPGVEQVIVSSRLGAARTRSRAASAGRGDLDGGRAGEHLAVVRGRRPCATRRASTGRFAGFFTIRPAHNPIGPFDFAGGYDDDPIARCRSRADRPRLRGRLPPVHRAGGRRQRRAHRSSPILNMVVPDATSSRRVQGKCKVPACKSCCRSRLNVPDVLRAESH